LNFGDEKMAVFSVIKLSELEGAKRIDAKYYDTYYLELEKKIKKGKWDYLRNLIVFNRRGIQPRYSDIPTKYRAVVSQNILEDFLDVDNLPFIEENFFNSKQSQEVKIKQYDILIYTTGANIGRTNIFYPKTIEAIASNHVNIIRADQSKINQLYLGVFLQSKIGRYWTDRWASGSDQEEIYPWDFERFPVLIADVYIQKEVANLVLKSFQLIESSNNLYSQAENLLLEELGLKDFNPKYEKTYTANLSDALSAHRIDAEYFQPAYEEVIEKLKGKNIELKSLRKFILRIQKGIEPGGEKYQNVGKPFIRVSNLSIYGFIDRDQKYLSEEIYQDLKENYEPKQGDVLLTKDATPGIAYVVKEEVEGIISSGIVKLQVNDREINKEYLALCINSFIGKMQAERDCVGSIIFHWKPEQIKQIKIPLLPLSTQQKIVSLIQKSHEARKKAKELLNVAKKTVEIAIKKNEEEALDYISKSIKKS